MLTSPDDKSAGVARGYDRNGGVDDFEEGMATGDGGVYSTVNDLLRFDQALYDDTLVRKRRLLWPLRPLESARDRLPMVLGGTSVETPLA